MNHLTLVTDDTFASLLELAANNDVEGFKRWIEHDPFSVDEVGLWYGRQKGLKQMVNEERTPLMVASTYGSIDVIKLIISSSDADVNRVCGRDKSTALHCAASGGADNVIDVVKLLLAAGADVNMVDANGHLPVDVIVVPPKLRDVKLTLEKLLATESSCFDSRVAAVANSDSPPLSPSQENGSLFSGSDSPIKSRPTDAPISLVSEKKEYPIDPSLPDIKNSIYSTDEFRMYSFKVRPCSRAYSHDWTECPFVHPGENARRRDPRKFHYSCVPCPDFRKGACRRGDMCEYAHGVFECWLHPAQYRTRLCKDGTSCARRVCFFAHTAEELRPLYVSTGSAVPSPRSSTSGATAMDFAAAMSLLPGSPSSVSVISPSPFTPPMSPSVNGMPHSNVGWPQPNVPALHLPGSNLQSSRLRSSLNARDIQAEDFNVRPCSRAYSHDWTECPFVHPGENARRRDPRKFHYSCVPCPDFRKGACRRGDMCEYAHGVFECWLHPAQYRTRLCKDGTSCARRVCFFAHTAEELRPLYVSTGSAVPSPRSSTSGATAMDFAAAMSLLPGSPSSVSVISPSPFTPPMSPSVNGMPHSNVGWPQPNVPALHLPGSNLQSSRLRSSLNARDIQAEDFNVLPDFDLQQHQLINELSSLTQPSMSSSSFNRSGRMKTMTPSNLDDLFSAESLSPRYSDQALAAAVFSPTHKSAVLNQFQQQQSMLSPINTNYSPKSIEHPLLQASLSGRMSPRNVEPISPMSSRVSMLAQREKQQEFRSLSSRELGSGLAAIVGSPVNSWSKWGSSNGKPDWAVNADGVGKHRRSSSFEHGNGDEPDLSWVQSLVKESPTEIKDKIAAPVSGEGSSRNSDTVDNAMLGAWLEQMQLDQLVAQQN
ncbi:hypothetical protein GOBAR_AA03759 [Gossypium barbadense]|uniref:C3H1-type domain-containing protein n=1 Tax=Gossypium barbadense TaxID=3634 RepID=A0A2P5YMI8_GOSBA|nr:hypothetical protein GOBAR_AA03759 [Gossypium barbadense]